MKFFIPFLIFIFINQNISCQIFENPGINYTKNENLPSNLVYGCLFDNDGLLWLCTDAGVIQYDGISSKFLTIKDGLPTNDVYHMFCDSKNRIWFTTLGSEISYYSKGKIHNQKNDSVLKQIKTNSLFPRYFELNSEIWVDLSPLDLFRINDSGVEKVLFNNFLDQSFRARPFDSNTILLLGEKRLIKYNIQNNNYSQLLNNGTEPYRCLEKVHNRYFALDNNANLFEVSNKFFNEIGVFINKRNDRLFAIQNLMFSVKNRGLDIYNNSGNLLKKDVFQNLEFTSICCNSEGIKWAGTFTHGLVKLDAYNWRTYLSNNIVTSITCIKNSIYAGTRNGDVFKFDKNTNKIVQISLTTPGATSNRILRIQDLNGKLIILSESSFYEAKYNLELIRDLNKTKYSTSNFKNLVFENEDTILLHSMGAVFLSKGKLTFYNSKKRVYSYTSYQGLNLIGTQDSILVSNDHFKSYKIDIPFSHRIMDMKTFDNILIVSTSDNGIYFIRNHKIVKNLTLSNGLNSNNCGRLHLSNGFLYVCSDNGISIIDISTFTIKCLFESDGLASNMINDVIVSNDTLYAASDGGLSLVPLESISKFKEFNLFAKPYAVKKDTVWDKPQEIVARTNQDITLVLNGTSYIKNTKKIYYYRIAELDSTFVSTLEKNILLNFHQTGHFHLEAYCVNAEGTKSKFLVIPIYIKPYFYQTIWFYLLLLALLVALIYFISRYYARLAKEKEQQKAAEEKRIRGLEIAAWRAGVNPHFLFNSLNGLQAFFRRNEFDKGNIYLSNFTQMLRNTVDTSNDLTLTVEEEIEYLREFLQFEQKKRDEKFEFFITYDTVQTLDYFIPSMVVQPVLENSLKHALSATKENIFTVNFRVEGERLVCVIADNGPGIRKTNREVRKSVGIALIRYKLRIIQKIINDPIEFFMKNRMDANHKPAGLETTFIFPLLTKRLKIDNEVDAENESKLIFEDSEENPNPPPPEEDSI